MNLLDKVKKEKQAMFDVFEVSLRFQDKCLGQVAEKLEARMAKVEALVRKGKMPEEVAESIKAENRERYRDAEVAKSQGEEGDPDGAKDAEKQMTNVFWLDDEGIYIESRIVKSALRDIFSQLDVFKTVRGSKGGHNLGMYVEPDRTHFRRDGKILQKADGVLEMPIHITDAAGRRSALTRSEYVERADLSFTIKMIKGGKLPTKQLPRALALMEDAGIGGKRSQGFGKLEITKLEKVS